MSATQELPRLTPAYRANSKWLLDHLADLAGEYPNQWVAVWDNRVVAGGPDLGAVTTEAARLAPAQDTVIHFVDDGSLIFLTTDHTGSYPT